MKPNLFIDIETFSPEDLSETGSRKYVQHPDFEIMLLAYAFDDDEVSVIDITQNPWPKWFTEYLKDPGIIKWAHNAAFERISFERQLEEELPIEQWRCTQILAASCGLPLALGDVAKVLGLTHKMEEGKDLIRYFCQPVESRKKLSQIGLDNYTRRTMISDFEKWKLFREYVKYDVIVEREIFYKLRSFIQYIDWDMYKLDQKINDRGIPADDFFAENARGMCQDVKEELMSKMRDLSGCDNPNSNDQLKDWIFAETGELVESITKDTIPGLIEKFEGYDNICATLTMKRETGKSSVKKFDRLLQMQDLDGRCRGLFQYLGASRTGRWAGRGIQLQNLKRIEDDLDISFARGCVYNYDIDSLELTYGNALDTISQLIRTAFVAPDGYSFAVADFSAIEARVTAWLSGEQWRLDVFRTHGKIYEASAAQILGKPIAEVTRDERQSIGKVSELAFGFGGGVGAAKRFGADKYFNDARIAGLVRDWRNKSPRVVAFWHDLEECAAEAIHTGHKQTAACGIEYGMQGDFLYCQLLSGRRLHYFRPSLEKTSKGEAIRYYGTGDKGGWLKLDTYGGKLCENVVQATAADLLMDAMKRMDKCGMEIVIHVHDEAGCLDMSAWAQDTYDAMIEIMSEAPDWAAGLPLAADGYVNEYYKK